MLAQLFMFIARLLSSSKNMLILYAGDIWYSDFNSYTETFLKKWNLVCIETLLYVPRLDVREI